MIANLRERLIERVRSFGPRVISGHGVIVLITAVGALAANAITGEEGGTTAEWVAAFATLMALMAALAAASYTGRTLKIESAREGARILADKQSQASLVAAWSTGNQRGSHEKINGVFTRQVKIDEVEIAVRNASPVPVTNVVLDVSWVVQQPGADRRRWHVGIRDSIRVLPPDTTKTFWVGTDANIPLATEPALQWGEVELHFTDSTGREWERLATGPLLLKHDPEATSVD